MEQDDRTYDFGLLSSLGVTHYTLAFDSNDVLHFSHRGFASGLEYFRLENFFPDFDENNVLDIVDLELLRAAVQSGQNDPDFDLDGLGTVDQKDLTTLVQVLMSSWIGDANLDGEFNTADFVQVFQFGEYEDDIVGNSTWKTGDWNADGEFDTGDLVTAFQSDGYERGSVIRVPEPEGQGYVIAILMSIVLTQRFSKTRPA